MTSVHHTTSQKSGKIEDKLFHIEKQKEIWGGHRTRSFHNVRRRSSSVSITLAQELHTLRAYFRPNWRDDSFISIWLAPCKFSETSWMLPRSHPRQKRREWISWRRLETKSCKEKVKWRRGRTFWRVPRPPV